MWKKLLDIDISNFSEGVYLVKIPQAKADFSTKKLIKLED